MSPSKLSCLPVEESLIEKNNEFWRLIIEANKSLSALKMSTKNIPDELILLKVLSLKEAKDSSEIENIYTTYEEIFYTIRGNNSISLATKEVINYSEAIIQGWEILKREKIISIENIIWIQKMVTTEKDHHGIRKQPVYIGNSKKIVYTPPKDPTDIMMLMNNLQTYMLEDNSLDPLVNLAITHYQFESIHPFLDGNGRTGRILNILYLVYKKLLGSPILFLSEYFNKDKNMYCGLLNKLGKRTCSWNDWIVYVLKAIDETAKNTIVLVEKISKEVDDIRQTMIDNKLFDGQYFDLINLIFTETQITLRQVMETLNISRYQANRRVEVLVKEKVLKKVSSGENTQVSIYVNARLVNILKDSK